MDVGGKRARDLLSSARDAFRQLGEVTRAIAASEAEVARRKAVCHECEFFVSRLSRCSKCGCFINVKSTLQSAGCPVGKW